MTTRRRAWRSLEAHLEEVMDQDDAREVVDHLESTVTREYLVEALARQADQLTDRLTGRLTASWRRDLLLVTGAQFFALAAAVAALVALG